MVQACRSRMLVLAWVLAACAGVARAETAHPVTWSESFGMDAVPAPDRADWQRWLAQPWQVEGRPVIFDVANEQGEQVRVGSCVALFEADARGMTGSYVDMDIYRARAAQCYAARIIADATVAEHSWLDGFTMDEAHVRQLPVWLSWMINNDDVRKVRRLHAAGGTLGDFIGDAVVSGDQAAATIKDALGGRRSLRIVARGDFNRDGIGDLMIASSSWIEGASYFGAGLSIVTRDAPGAPIRVVERIPVMGPGIGLVPMEPEDAESDE